MHAHTHSISLSLLFARTHTHTYTNTHYATFKSVHDTPSNQPFTLKLHHLCEFFFFFFCVPGHARFSVRWVRRSPQSAAVSQPVPKASCGPPPDWAMSGVSSHRRWGRTAGCGWGFENPCCMDIRLSGKFSVCGGGRGVDSVQFSV